MAVIEWGQPIFPKNKEEERLLNPFINYLVRTNRINSKTIVRHELPWNGRRIDLATLSQSLSTTAYELK
ncbi:hypothetical protein, partial [Brevibacterium casei]|uniref:hypothetical protein n=1 Tax=Brevibacterium casei TaxID=33889 RepID=UPI001C92F3E9